MSAAHDDDAADSTVTLKHAVAGAGEYAGTDPSEVEGVVIPGTTGYPVPDVVVTIEDNDTAAVTVNPVNLTVAEGAEATYTLVLTSEPVGYVEIAAHVDGSTTALQTVTFTASDWDDPRTVAFTPPEDADINDSSPHPFPPDHHRQLRRVPQRFRLRRGHHVRQRQRGLHRRRVQCR